MPIQEHHIKALQTIYLKQCGRDLSHQDAWAMAHRLVNLIRILTQSDGESLEIIRTFPSLPPRRDD